MPYYEDKGIEINEKTEKVIRKILFLIFLAVSFVPFILVHSAFEKNESGQMDSKGCTKEVNAKVVRILSKVSKDTDKDGNSYGREHTAYAPVYHFEVNGIEYDVESIFYSREQKYEVGDEVKILIEPDNPKHIYNPENKSDIIFAYGLTLIYPVLYLFFTIGLRIIFKKSRR